MEALSIREINFLKAQNEKLKEQNKELQHDNKQGKKRITEYAQLV